jgi:threonine synthase
MQRYWLQCFDCQSKQQGEYTSFRCEKCGGLLEVKFKLTIKRPNWKNRSLSVWKYKELLPIDHQESIVSLGEGGTGLHHCKKLGKKLGLKNLYVKNEGENPTGSFKDRGMTVAVSKAVEQHRKRVVCASTGNTSASLAAYSAKAGLDCIVFIPKGKIAPGKMIQVIIHGAKIVEVDGDFDKALEIVVKLVTDRTDLYLMNSVNPYRLEGQKTLGFEIHDQLDGQSPDSVLLPVGNGGNISAVWKGFTELHQLGLSRDKPRMIGIQAARAAPIVRAIRSNATKILPVAKAETIATAIRIGSPVNWPKVLHAIRDSNGTAETVTDIQILNAQAELARDEGIFVEPASAASIAGLEKMVEDKKIDKQETIVCVTTGHGLKDPSIIDRIPSSKQFYNLTGNNTDQLIKQLF